ncbi:hypothetical protein B0H10DRAFT_2029785 [Mycena sp. CBHHK59/15]|nr:hypothetical protein B0H10DRAFT_2029785 [Mycena sp. CBHHK59/15]
MTPPPDSTISVAEILALASFISKHSPVYDLLESSCFYYGRAIFDVTRTLMHCTGADIVTTDDFSFMKSDALQWHAHVIRVRRTWSRASWPTGSRQNLALMPLSRSTRPPLQSSRRVSGPRRRGTSAL